MALTNLSIFRQDESGGAIGVPFLDINHHAAQNAFPANSTTDVVLTAALIRAADTVMVQATTLEAGLSVQAIGNPATDQVTVRVVNSTVGALPAGAGGADYVFRIHALR